MNTEKNKLSNKSKVAQAIQRNSEISKPEIAARLGLSMPTVLQIVKNLIDDGLVIESGKQKSNGGRKAAALSISENYGFSCGIDITANHISFVLLNLQGNTAAKKRIKSPYENSRAYYEFVCRELEEFTSENETKLSKIIGVGISLPGIIDKENDILIRSHILRQDNVSLKGLRQIFPCPIAFENDANSALLAEMNNINTNTVYLSLSNSVGGAICIDNEIYRGDLFKSAEFGHIIVVPGGRKCYCGKKGCADAYCSAQVLLKYADSIESFFEKLDGGDANANNAWEEYLGYLALLISNLRMAFDCDIMLGGYVGGYMKKYMRDLGQRVVQNNMFESDTLYLKNCKYESEASAVGAAMHFIDEFFITL